jgi:leader peptidase (prepilin peptidase) / N-methyltransferase
MQAPGWVLAGAGAVIGLMAGSYLTLLADRIPVGGTVIHPPGRCAGCGATLRATAMIPVASWLLSRGRCVTCQAPIRTWQPAVEGATGLLFALMALRFGLSPVLPAFWYFAALSVALAVIDLRYRRLPDLLTLPAYPVGGLLLGVAALAVPGGLRHVAGALAGMAAAWLFFLLLVLIHPAGLGWGDVKLSGVIGLYLGWLGITAVAAGLFGAFVLAAVTGLALIAAGRATRKSQIPFGPFMLVAALAVILCSGLVSR